MRSILAALLVLAAPLALFAGDAPAAPAPEGPVWISFLASDAFWNAVAVALTFLIGLLSKLAWVQNTKKRVDADVWTALEAGVIKTYHDSVKTLKGAAADRKITPEEAAALRTEALENAKAIASGPGKDALIKMAQPVANALIERVLGAVKRSNSTPPEHDTAQ